MHYVLSLKLFIYSHMDYIPDFNTLNLPYAHILSRLAYVISLQDVHQGSTDI